MTSSYLKSMPYLMFGSHCVLSCFGNDDGLISPTDTAESPRNSYRVSLCSPDHAFWHLIVAITGPESQREASAMELFNDHEVVKASLSHRT